MSALPLKLILLARDESPRVQNAWNDLSEFVADAAGVEVVASARHQGIAFDHSLAELAVVFGGDGAILWACRQFGTDQIPILGINLGRLGFLADLFPNEFCENFDQIRGRHFRIVDHLMFECELKRADGTAEVHLGLNEAAVRASGLQMLDVELAINGEPVTTYGGDGLIVSTPVGSTAHSLSAGGPLLRQDLQAFAITPICPHALSNRPLVDHADRVYTLHVPNADDGAMLVIDGQIRRVIQPGDTIEIRRASVTFKLARIPGHSYYAMLYRKLGWGGHTRKSADTENGETQEGRHVPPG